MRTALRERFRADAILFATGREALLALLRALDVRPGQEIILQGYTCIVVANAIHAAGAVPVYADIDPETLNLTADTVRPLITPRTRALICQHTFGIPAQMEELWNLCEEHSITLIEDCAHILPDELGPDGVCARGDFAILSFGRDKAISGISGGAVLSREPKRTAILRELERTALTPSLWSVAKLLEYPGRMRLVRFLSGTPLLRPALWILGRLGLIAPVVTEREKAGAMSPILHRIPNACAVLALRSLSRLPFINEHRRTLTKFFLRHGKEHEWPMPDGIAPDLPLQKFPMFVRHAAGLRRKLLRYNIHLDDGWTGCAICPSTADQEAAGYADGTRPIAEDVGRHIISLPTHPTMSLYQAKRLADLLDAHLPDHR